MIKLRRLKKRKKISAKPMIYITTILMLNCMGIGYGVWSENLNLDFSVSTGYIEPQFNIDSIKEAGNKKGDLEYSLSNDNRTLTITGEIHPKFNKNIFLGIENNGSMPIQLEGIETEIDNDIIKSIDNKNIYIEPNKKGEFKLHIQDGNNKNSNYKIEDYDIQGLTELLETYNTPETHVFKYKVRFEQGIR